MWVISFVWMGTRAPPPPPRLPVRRKVPGLIVLASDGVTALLGKINSVSGKPLLHETL